MLQLGRFRLGIVVASLALGDQVEAEWIPLFGIVYDPKSDIIEIASEQLDHMIRKPRAIAVEEGPDGVSSIEIIDGEDTVQIVKLRDPMMPAPR